MTSVTGQMLRLVAYCLSAHSDTNLYNHWLINYLRDRPMRLLAYGLGPAIEVLAMIVPSEQICY